jgi:hypothetical protein
MSALQLPWPIGEGPERKLGFFAPIMTCFIVDGFAGRVAKSEAREIIKEIFALFSTHQCFDDVRIVTRVEFKTFRDEWTKTDPKNGKRLKSLEKSLRSLFSFPWSFHERSQIPEIRLSEMQQESRTQEAQLTGAS